MNKTGIEWADYTWNPVTGCNHGCPYCYARKIAERFKGSKAWPKGFDPMFHPERMNDPQKMKVPQTIFVCSMADLFGEWVPQDWIHRVFISCQQAPQHTYIFLTKNPGRIEQLSVHSCFEEFMNCDNVWFGTSITEEKDVMSRWAPLIASDLPNRFISFEPLLGDVGEIDLTGIKQVIIGAQTNPAIYPDPQNVMDLRQEARRVKAKVFFKDTITYLEPLRELCWSVKK